MQPVASVKPAVTTILRKSRALEDYCTDVRSSAPTRPYAGSDPDGWRDRALRNGTVVGRILLVVVGVVLAALAIGFAIVAWRRLSRLAVDDPWRNVAQDVLKTAYQGLVIGALGGLLKIWIDQGRQRAAEQRELVRIRTEVIDGVVHCSHQLDTGRTLLRANRSVRTLSDVMTDIVIPARVQLREISHDLRTWHDAKVPILDTKAFLAVTYYLYRQVQYTDDLLDEYADHKQPLGEMQWHAEQTKTPTGRAKDEAARDAADAVARARRAAALTVVNEALDGLAMINGYTSGTGDYGEFRSSYIKTLTTLRGALSRGRLRTLPSDVPSDWIGYPAEGDDRDGPGQTASESGAE